MLQINPSSLAARPAGVGMIRSAADVDVAASGDVRVIPLARGLTVLAAFRPERPWMSNHEVGLATGLPGTTVSRMLSSLVALGYLHHDSVHRKYRLAAATLSLGYAATAAAELQRAAHIEMRKFADATDTHVVLGTRNRLDVILLEAQVGQNALLDLRLTAGTCLPMATCPMGWALLAALPDPERFYLLSNVERRSGGDWPALRRRLAEGMSQLHTLGFCASSAYGNPELVTIAVPVTVPDHPSAVLACVGRSARMTRVRIQRELGPRLVAMSLALQERLGIVV